jgi:hypothetical protein
MQQRYKVQDRINVLTIYEMAILTQLKAYADALSEKTNCHIEYADIYNIDLINLRSYPEQAHQLSFTQRASLQFAIWSADFIAHFIIDDETWGALCDGRGVNADDHLNARRIAELGIKFCSLHHYFMNVKDDLDKDVSELFSSHFDRIFSVLPHANAQLASLGYMEYFNEKRMQAITMQLQGAGYSMEKYQNEMHKFLKSSLNKKDKFMFLSFGYEKFSNNLDFFSEFNKCIDSHARQGVGAASYWMLIFNEENMDQYAAKLLSNYSIEESALFIKGLLLDAKYQGNDLAPRAFCVIAILITENISNIEKSLVKELVDLLRLNSKLLSGDACKEIAIVDLYKIILAFDDVKAARKDLGCYIYAVKLVIATVLKSMFKGSSKGAFIAYLKRNDLKIPVEVYDYLALRENYLEIIKVMRLFGEARRSKDNIIFSLFSIQPELLRKSVVQVGNIGEDEVDAVMGFTQKHFYKPV